MSIHKCRICGKIFFSIEARVDHEQQCEDVDDVNAWWRHIDDYNRM